MSQVISLEEQRKKRAAKTLCSNFQTTDDTPTLNERIERIKSSIRRINDLMAELKSNEEPQLRRAKE